TAGELAGLARTFRCRPEELQLRPVRMIVLLCREHAGQEERHFRAIAAGLKYYGLWYGPYPYETVTLVDPPFGADVGGMEYPTLFTAGTSLSPEEGTRTPEMVIVHEFGHGYWYGMVGNNEFEDPWLDEGINTYSTGKVLEKAYGPARIPFRPGGLPLSRYLRGLTYQDADLDRLAGIQAVPWDAVTTWAWKFSSSMSYGLNVYSRAATLLTTLEHLLGEEVLMRVLRTYFQRFRFGHPRHADFVAVAEEVSGRPLGWFFRSLFEDTLVFDYAVTDLHSTQAETPRGVFERDGRKWTVTATEAEKRDRARQGAPYRTLVRVRRLGPARIGGDARLQIRVAFADGRQKSVFWDGQAAWAEFSFQEPSPALRADIDPDGIYPIDANRSNNGRTVSPRAAPSLRWTGRIQFWLQNLFHLVGFFS
ncbi:MAG TPA: M1 family aminopeptidase, partial [Candidatus Aminicenantes bacterium]|nr:M1 family aminopeptidase [Candidatus Aminicenantes bacterium]